MANIMREMPSNPRKARRWLRQNLVHAAGCVFPGCACRDVLPDLILAYGGPPVSVPRSLRAEYGRFIRSLRWRFGGIDVDVRMEMIAMPLAAALALGADVGVADHIAMTTTRLCFIAGRAWDDACTEQAAALAPWHGPLILPPFTIDPESNGVRPAPGHEHVVLVQP